MAAAAWTGIPAALPPSSRTRSAPGAAGDALGASATPLAGGGPASGAFLDSLDDAGKATLRDTVRASLPEGPFTLPARAWLALGTVPG